MEASSRGSQKHTSEPNGCHGADNSCCVWLKQRRCSRIPHRAPASNTDTYNWEVRYGAHQEGRVVVRERPAWQPREKHHRGEERAYLGRQRPVRIIGISCILHFTAFLCLIRLHVVRLLVLVHHIWKFKSRAATAVTTRPSAILQQSKM